MLHTMMKFLTYPIFTPFPRSLSSNLEFNASRSDEKGFEGASGGKQSTTKVEKDKFIHENHPAYNEARRNEVKEKNKTRH
ncbi:hypothetical protein GYH30_001082 [Glycine max]|uniref:Uncharacterized protein n=1 Tax=Glycine max TaxID=3847 RepID=A0A0R0LFQ6_SOYBN|nr:hypothetical protein GYH30_001082 [Glycine max]